VTLKIYHRGKQTHHAMPGKRSNALVGSERQVSG
jgi:hypothetical protein